MDLQTQLRVRASVWYNKEHGGNHGPVRSDVGGRFGFGFSISRLRTNLQMIPPNSQMSPTNTIHMP